MTASSSRSAIAAVAAAVILAGCGGGSSFTSKADSICKDSSARLKAIPRPKTFAGLLDQASAEVHKARTKVGALKPPADKAGAYAAYLSALQGQIGVFDQARALAHAGKTREALLVLGRGRASAAALRARAKALGLKGCSR